MFAHLHIWVWLGPTKYTHTLKLMLILTNISTSSIWGTSATWQTPSQPLGPMILCGKLSRNHAIPQNRDPNTFSVQPASPRSLLGFFHTAFPSNTLMQTFYVFTYLAQSGSSWFVFKVPSELPLVCVLRITNDYGLWCPNSFQMGSVHMVAWVWDQPFSVLAQAVGIGTWRTEISQHRGGKTEGVSQTLMQFSYWCPQVKVNIVTAVGKNARNAL